MDIVTSCLRWMTEKNASLVVVKKKVESEYMQKIRGDLKEMVWLSPGCIPPSQYVDKVGRIVAVYPGTVTSYAKQIHGFTQASVNFL